MKLPTFDDQEFEHQLPANEFSNKHISSKSAFQNFSRKTIVDGNEEEKINKKELEVLVDGASQKGEEEQKIKDEERVDSLVPRSAQLPSEVQPYSLGFDPKNACKFTKHDRELQQYLEEKGFESLPFVLVKEQMRLSPKHQEEGVRRDVAFKNCLRIIKRVVMSEISKEIQIQKTGPEIYFMIDDWYERHFKGTLIEELMNYYKVKRQEMVELLIAIMNPLVARKLNRYKPFIPRAYET